jgi:hypothetical protein
MLREEAFQARKERDEALALTQELKKELNYALAELHQARANARPEPSRLEIAAIAMQAFISSSGFIIDIPKVSLEYADALIAAAREAK